MIEVETIDDDEYELLEAAVAQAEQQYAAKASSRPASTGSGPHPPPGPQLAPFPPVTEGPAAEPSPKPATTGKRKLPASFSGLSKAAEAAAPPPQFPVLTYQGAVQYAYTGVEVDGLCQLLLSSGIRQCGFDIEWLVSGLGMVF
jgi:hypothetical protein